MATLFGKSRRKRDRSGSSKKEELPITTSNNDEAENDKKISDKLFSSSSSSNRIEKTQEGHDVVLPSWASFDDLGLSEPLVNTCRQLGFKRPTPVQRTVIPFLLKEDSAHLLALANTGSGKTAAFVLPILQKLSADPYGIYAVILTPTRELAKQIHQQVLALGSAYNAQSALVVGGLDPVRQSCELDRRPHFCVATPGRLAELLRGPKPPRLKHARYIVLDEADRLLAANSGFERDVAELLLHCTTTTTTTTTSAGEDQRTTKRRRRSECQTLLFSATMSRSLERMEEMAGAGLGRLPLKKFVVREGLDDSSSTMQEESATKKRKDASEKSQSDNENDSDGDDVSPTGSTPKIPVGLKQEYVFMPSRVRDAYLLTTLRELMVNGGRSSSESTGKDPTAKGSGWTITKNLQDDDDDDESQAKARSAIVFVSTCERAGFVSGLLSQVGVDNVALHSLLSQNRRLASLGKFKSQQVRVLVATDVASRGLDIPSVDLIINSELPRNPISYVHRVGRTARAGRRGRAISLVAESDIGLVHAAERISGRSLEKCTDITDDMAIKLLGPVAKAARLTKMKLMDIGFDELVEKFRERKTRDRKERERIERALRRIEEK